MTYPFNLHQLRIFQAVAHHLSFSRAASELYLSQPAVSMQIKALEKALGVELFEQVGRRTRLTAGGEELATQTQRLFELLDETVTALDDLKGLRRGNLRVAATTTVGIYVVPRALGLFRARNPGINCSLEVCNWARAVDALVKRDAELAIAGRIEEGPDLAIEPFMANELVVIASPNHPLAKLEFVPIDELRNETILIREQGSGTRAGLERLFADRGWHPRYGMELNRNGALKQAVAANLGIGVISKEALSLELATGTLVILNVEGFPILRHWHVIHLAEKRLSDAAAAFKKFLPEYQHIHSPVGQASDRRADQAGAPNSTP